jgi:hypothetical protein
MVERRDVEFEVEGGDRLRGWLFVPENRSARHPGISMAHGYAGVKEHGLERFARAFTEAGFVVLVHDHRNFGSSDGAIRHDIGSGRSCRARHLPQRRERLLRSAHQGARPPRIDHRHRPRRRAGHPAPGEEVGFAADSPVEREGFSDNLPKGEAFCGFHDPSSRSCVSRTCIPGNQENATSLEPMGSLGPIRRSPSPCWVRRDLH